VDAACCGRRRRRRGVRPLDPLVAVTPRRDLAVAFLAARSCTHTLFSLRRRLCPLLHTLSPSRVEIPPALLFPPDLQRLAVRATCASVRECPKADCCTSSSLKIRVPHRRPTTEPRRTSIGFLVSLLLTKLAGRAALPPLHTHEMPALAWLGLSPDTRPSALVALISNSTLVVCWLVLINAVSPFVLSSLLHVPAARAGAITGRLLAADELTALALYLPAGALGDWLGVKWVAAFGHVVVGCAFVAYASARSVGELVAARVLFAVRPLPLSLDLSGSTELMM